LSTSRGIPHLPRRLFWIKRERREEREVVWFAFFFPARVPPVEGRRRKEEGRQLMR